jgi:type VI secretion system secreted protein Hcp
MKPFQEFNAMALFDAFLKIEGIDGESADAKHKGDIQLESFSWSEHQTGTAGTGGGLGAGKVAMQDFHITKKVDKASPKLMVACADGEHIKKATLVCRKAGKDQQEFMKWTFTDILVSSYSIGASAQGDHLPMEQVSMNYSKFEMEYKEQTSGGTLGGTVKAGWDVKANKKI